MSNTIFPGGVNAFRVTATGALCVTSANAHIVGILFQGTATNVCRLFVGVTATGTATVGLGRIVANASSGATVNSATYIPFPAYASGGFCVSNAGAVDGSADPSITLFWNPAGGA